MLYQDEDIDENKRAADIKKLRDLYDEYQNDRIKRIGIENFRDKVVADFGCGVGSFLDAICGFSQKTIAIEPARYVHDELNKKHRVFSHVKELVDDGTRIDIATSFEVIEHVEDPVEFLSKIYKTLKDGSVFYLTTPNYDDILNDLAKEQFEPFYYKTEHLYYFCPKSIDYVYRKAGFKNYKIGFYHRFDLSNLLLWMKLGRPTGKNRYSLFDEEFNKR